MKLPKKYSVADLVSPLLALLLLLTLSSCAEMKNAFNFTSIDEEGNEINSTDPNLPAKTLLLQGMDDYNVGKYFSALEYFEEILDRYPFSAEATLAELKAADCNYYMERYTEAFALYKQFEERHPTNEAIPYVMFQKGMTQYKRMDRVDRDTTGAIESIKLFDQLLRAYPDSPYSAEAQARILDANEFLADHEFAVAQFFIRTKKYSQAQKRLKYLLTMYPNSKVSPQATELLAQLEAGTPPDAGLKEWLPSLPKLGWPELEE